LVSVKIGHDVAVWHGGAADRFATVVAQVVAEML
jgi:hypothetical protein